MRRLPPDIISVIVTLSLPPLPLSSSSSFSSSSSLLPPPLTEISDLACLPLALRAVCSAYRRVVDRHPAFWLLLRRHAATAAVSANVDLLRRTRMLMSPRVRLPDAFLALARQLPRIESPDDMCRLRLMAAHLDNVEDVIALADPRLLGDRLRELLLVAAASLGCVRLAAALVDAAVDAAVDDSLPLRVAAEWGHTDVLRLLLSHPAVDPAAVDSYALRWAAMLGHAAAVRLLLDDGRSDVYAREGDALGSAAANGHDAVVAELLRMPHGVDMGRHGHFALNAAVFNNHASVVRLLLQASHADGRPQVTAGPARVALRAAAEAADADADMIALLRAHLTSLGAAEQPPGAADDAQ